jgi:hypothetical protein
MLIKPWMPEAMLYAASLFIIWVILPVAIAALLWWLLRFFPSANRRKLAVALVPLISAGNRAFDFVTYMLILIAVAFVVAAGTRRWSSITLNWPMPGTPQRYYGEFGFMLLYAVFILILVPKTFALPARERVRRSE